MIWAKRRNVRDHGAIGGLEMVNRLWAWSDTVRTPDETPGELLANCHTRCIGSPKPATHRPLIVQ